MVKKTAGKRSGDLKMKQQQQKQMDHLKIARITIHLLSALMFSYGVFFFDRYIEFPNINNLGFKFGGKLKFLTTINAIVQAVYFIIALLNDLFGSNKVLTNDKLPVIRKIRDYLFCSLAFPVALIVTISFWSLMAVDRELIFPAAFDEFFPSWLNHVLHTNVSIFIVLELFTSFRQYPKRKNGLKILFVFMAAYLVWVHIVKHYSGFWVYPVLKVLNLPLRLVFFAVTISFTSIFYFLGEFVNNLFWRKELKQLTPLKRK